jgi:nicotinate-nucleotide--dimethylbenzimidazole phosphoribosyltransferase
VTKFKRIVNSIKPIGKKLEPQILQHLNSLTKPHGSLGKLENIVLQYCLITGKIKPEIGRKQIVVFAADHGVAAEGVSAYPQEVTAQMVRNILNGGAAVNVLARHVNAEVCVVDIGVAGTFDDVPGLLQRKVKPGTENITTGQAMSNEEVLKAIETGIEMAEDAIQKSVAILGTGEMGIANTTPSSALFAALLPCRVEEVTVCGTGIDDQMIYHKAQVIKKALAVNKDKLTDPVNTLAALGGFEIAGICGLILGAAVHRIPVVVDGFISSAAALVACKISDTVKDYLFFSHCSAEKGHQIFFERFGIQPILNLDMRLGEGTGSALAMSIIEASVKIYNEMATFDSAGVDKELMKRKINH